MSITWITIPEMDWTDSNHESLSQVGTTSASQYYNCHFQEYYYNGDEFFNHSFVVSYDSGLGYWTAPSLYGPTYLIGFYLFYTAFPWCATYTGPSFPTGYGARWEYPYEYVTVGGDATYEAECGSVYASAGPAGGTLYSPGSDQVPDPNAYVSARTDYFASDDSGTGGDPHYVGFDGDIFEYGGGQDHYLLYRDEYSVISAKHRFNTDPKYPLDQTFIREMCVRLRGQGSTKNYTISATRPLPAEPPFIAETDPAKLTKEEALPEKLRYITGDVLDITRLHHGGSLFVFSRMVYSGSIYHLNLRVIGKPTNATGVLGQTHLSPQHRQGHGTFKLG